MKHGTHWHHTNAIGVDNWTLVKTATFSKRASGEVLLRANLSIDLPGVGDQWLSLAVESDKGVEYEIPYAKYGFISGANVIATIDVSDVMWLRVWVKKNSNSPEGGCCGWTTFGGGLWFDREVNDIQWV